MRRLGVLPLVLVLAATAAVLVRSGVSDATSVVLVGDQTGTAAETSAQTSLTTLPGTWTTGKAYKDGPLSAYGSTASSPVLLVSPTSLTFTGSVGGPDPAQQNLGVANGGNGTLAWSATP